MVFPFERLRDRLLTAGISPRHVRRYMSELADHFDDLEAEAKRAGHPDAATAALERIGRPDNLARAMIDRVELRGWTARAPWAVFLFGPAVLLAAIDFITVVSIVAIVKTADLPTGQPAPAWLLAMAATVNHLHDYIVPLLLAAAVVFVATRQRMRPLWPVAGLVVVAGVAALNHLQIEPAVVPGKHGEISLGASLGPQTAVRVAVNLMLTLPFYFAWWRWRQPRPA
jgi:hypothetical protein